MPNDANANYYYPDAGGTHGPFDAGDDDRTTAWVEDGFGTHGYHRDVISWKWNQTQTIRLICVRNGFDSDSFSFGDTGQVKQMHIDGCGQPFIEHSFPRRVFGQPTTFDYQDIRESCRTDGIAFVILSIYRDAHGNNQVGLSDVTFWG
jgi:hypothetical protein